MAKTKEADNWFEPDDEYLARAIGARWTSLPSVGEDVSGLSIQIKLSVLYRLKGNAAVEFVGREFVVYIPVTKDLEPTLSRGADFLRDLGVQVAVHQGAKDKSKLDHGARSLVCYFSETDPVHGYQSIVDWWLTDTSKLDLAACQTIMTVPRKKFPFGLEFTDPLTVTRNGVPIDFRLASRCYYVFKRLAYRYPDVYPTEALGNDAWKASGRKVPSELNSAVYSAIAKLRTIINKHGLEIPENRGAGGYCLREKAMPNGPKKPSPEKLSGRRVGKHLRIGRKRP